jgi:hypothetical protein
MQLVSRDCGFFIATRQPERYAAGMFEDHSFRVAGLRGKALLT